MERKLGPRRLAATAALVLLGGGALAGCGKGEPEGKPAQLHCNGGGPVSDMMASLDFEAMSHQLGVDEKRMRNGVLGETTCDRQLSMQDLNKGLVVSISGIPDNCLTVMPFIADSEPEPTANDTFNHVLVACPEPLG